MSRCGSCWKPVRPRLSAGGADRAPPPKTPWASPSLRALPELERHKEPLGAHSWSRGPRTKPLRLTLRQHAAPISARFSFRLKSHAVNSRVWRSAKMGVEAGMSQGDVSRRLLLGGLAQLSAPAALAARSSAGVLFYNQGNGLLQKLKAETTGPRSGDAAPRWSRPKPEPQSIAGCY